MNTSIELWSGSSAALFGCSSPLGISGSFLLSYLPWYPFCDDRSTERSEAMSQAYFTTPEAAEFISDNFFPTSPKSLAKWRCVGGGPRFRKVGSRKIIYDRADLIAWAEGRISPAFANTTEAGAA